MTLPIWPNRAKITVVNMANAAIIGAGHAGSSKGLTLLSKGFAVGEGVRDVDVPFQPFVGNLLPYRVHNQEDEACREWQDEPPPAAANVRLDALARWRDPEKYKLRPGAMQDIYRHSFQKTAHLLSYLFDENRG